MPRFDLSIKIFYVYLFFRDLYMVKTLPVYVWWPISWKFLEGQHREKILGVICDPCIPQKRHSHGIAQLVTEQGDLPSPWLGFHSSGSLSNSVTAGKRKINTHEARILCHRIEWATPRPAASQMSALPEEAAWANEDEDEHYRAGWPSSMPCGSRRSCWVHRGKGATEDPVPWEDVRLLPAWWDQKKQSCQVRVLDPSLHFNFC